MSELIVHASAVAWPDGPKGLLITGPSGSGKSALALSLLAFGCGLVADDMVRLVVRDGQLWAEHPGGPAGIEARGVGPLAAPLAGAAPLVLAVDMGAEENSRLPPLHEAEWLGVKVPLVHKSASGHFPPAILHYLKYGRLRDA